MHIPIIIHLLKYSLLNIIFGNADMAKVPLLRKLSKSNIVLYKYFTKLNLSLFKFKPFILLYINNKYIFFDEVMKH